MRLRLTVLWFPLLLTVNLLADEISLVRVGDPWRYCAGTNEPSFPLAAWRGVDFDDTNWREGPSGFSNWPQFATLEATFWNDNGLVHSFYVRRRFSLMDPKSIKWLVLRLDYHSGFVAYLNGQEIARRGLANEQVTYGDYADYHEGGAAEEFDVSASAGFLSVGDNILAIQIHTATTNPPPYANTLRLVPELLANFQRGPFLQNTSTNSTQLIWRTPVAANSVVEFGLDPSLGTRATDTALVTNHVMTLTNLLPGAKYYYRVLGSTGDAMAASTVASFRTLKLNGDFSFLVLGDSGAGTLAQYQLARQMEQTEADLVLHCGDIVYDYFLLGREDYRCLSVYNRQMRSVPFYFTMGNHEVETPFLDQPYLSTFYLPTNTATGTEHFYSFDHGNAHFVVLFVPSLEDVPELRPFQLTNGSPQFCWLTNDLAATTKPWKFLFFHKPMINSGYHRVDDENANGIYDRLELQDWLMPVMQRYGVQLMFSGNDHDYERLNPIGGVQQIVTGGGGGFLPPYYITERDPACSQFYLLSHFTKVTVKGDALFLQAIGTNGAVFDYMTIQRVLPPPQVYNATWHTPLVESFSADDGHGNINGQTFDFVGTAIATLPGDFSNLGRAYVNNDATNLFIGFEQTMFYSSNNIFLFIESPRQHGVSNLIGLGDGTANTAQGVDGLDFLENLGFTNFAPSVACLLGDEYADGQARHFARPGLNMNVGQGVFRLDTNFSDVAGVRLQQFNRSPQVLEPPPQLRFPEQNANFIEVAIPYDQLGGLRPGDTVKIAAVVGGRGYEANLQTRELDTAFLGVSMSGSGFSNVVLGALSVRLALDPTGDEDADGLPNGWEMEHNLDPFSASTDDGATGDPDHDGATNWQEFLAGTDPRDPASVLRLHITTSDSLHYTFSWPAVVGKGYQLEISSDARLFTNHLHFSLPRVAKATNEVFDEDFSTNSLLPVRFYRLRVAP
jgi:hypothetical protein